ncbi:restriction endonuclease subunit S [Campylobacter upsaliensis]|uniref:restriction endonuclease subunit S n=1 Tax=Campylobacter upsaliensis TaxID=28080 RepID=UPI002B3B38BE|nr:restriction endonuclease subunit S [Campylobacter upsaliensis]MEB2816577.1 restriction endonuclease subunit S [Campylobacter upsaliensis]
MKALNNNANPLESLLKQHCPDGVEFKELQEICKLQAGDRIIKSMMNDKAKYPVMGGGTEPTGYYHDYNFNQAITIARAGSAGYVAWQEGKFWATDVCFVAILPISHCETSARKSRQSTNTKSKQMDCHEFDKSNSRNDKVILKFVFYVLKANEYELKKHLYGGSMPKLDKNYLWSFQIPIPPLEIQQKIVDILDAFTELQAELQAELHARRKQYEYYRNKLLSFEELQRRTDMLNGGGLKLVTLGEVCEILDNLRKPITKSKRIQGIYPYYGANGIQDYVNEYIFDGDFLLIGEDGSVINKDNSPVLNWVSGKFWVNNHAHILKEKSNITNLRFVFFYLQTCDVSSIVRGVPPKINQQNLKTIQIPLPPLAVQNDIVELLDKFDTLANDLTSGIPAEIEARKKQYEYYRERLLNFIAKD